MLKNVFRIILTLSLMFFFYASAQAFTTLPAGKKPLPVQTGLYVNHVISLDETSETMLFNATLTLRWHDPSLAFSASGDAKVRHYGTGASKMLLAQIWHPQVGLVDASGPRKIKMMDIDINSDGTVTWVEEFEASVSVFLNLHRFPFDGQTLNLVLQPFIYNAGHVQLTVLKNATGVSKEDRIQGWRFVDSKAKTSTHLTKWQGKEFSRLTLSLQYKRLASYYFYQLFIPIIFIVLLSFSVFWMLDNPLVNRVAISLTAVLTIVVFHWRIMMKMPRINYHSYADTFMLISFIVAASTVIASIFLNSIPDKERQATCVRTMRMVYIIVYLLSPFVLALFYY